MSRNRRRRAHQSILQTCVFLWAFCAPATLPAQQPTPAIPSLQTFDPAVAEAQRLMHANQFPQAEAVLREDLRTNPRDADAAYALAYCLLREDHAAEALKQYTVAAALRAPTSDELVNVGQAYVILGDDPDADKWTRRAVQEDPRNAQAWYGLGRIRYTDQRFADAASCFKHALTLSPHNVKAANNLGLAYEGQNRTEDAIAAYRQAIAWQGAELPADRSEQPLLNLSIILLHRGDLAGAQPLLTEAVAIAPRDPRIHEQLGHLFLQQSRFDTAAKEFQTAITGDPRNSGLHFLLGQAFRRLGRTQDAQAEFATAARLAQPSPASSTH